MTTAIIYARVSTEDQLEKYGLPTQLRACREYAAKAGFTVTAEVTDDGISGTILDRPGLEKVRRMVRERQADAVVILDVDRLSRDLAHLLILKPEIERTARLEFVTAKFEDSPSGRMFFGIRGVIGQYERELTRERTMRGKKERARDGLIVGGRVAYGYTYDAGRLVPDPERAGTVRRIYADYEAGSSMRGIAIALRRDGIPTWSGRSWGKSSVHRILLNETYAGVAHYGTHRRDGKLLRLRAIADRIALDVPAIVSRDQWERVQARLSANPYVGRPSLGLLLRGLLHCGKCGRKMSGESGKKSRAYRCLGRDPLRVTGEICKAHTAAALLDAVAWRELTRVFSDASFLKDSLRRHEEQLRSISPGDIDDLRKRAAKFRRAEDAAVSAMLDPDLAESRTAIKAKYRAAGDERRRIEAEIASVERSRRVAISSGEWLDSTVRMVQGCMAGITDAETKQQFIRRVVNRAEWNGEEVRMSCLLAGNWAQCADDRDDLAALEFVVIARVAA